MSRSTRCLSDLQGLSRGISKVAESFVQIQKDCAESRLRQLVTNDLEHITHDLENKFVQQFTASSPKESVEKLSAKANAFARQAVTLLKSDAFKIFSSPQTRNYHMFNHYGGLRMSRSFNIDQYE